MSFIGGPFNPGHHQAVLTYLRAHDPTFPKTIVTQTFPSDDDLDRAMPRHFRLDENSSDREQPQPPPSL